jgi:hypothetical protein
LRPGTKPAQILIVPMSIPANQKKMYRQNVEIDKSVPVKKDCFFLWAAAK